MKNINPKRIYKNKYVLLVVMLLLIILASRISFLGADLPSTHVELEETPGGFNARNMVFFNHWPLYRNWFQPMVYVPLANFISYLSFRFLGVGLTQFRFPFVLAGFLGLIVFYLVLLKQTNRTFALLALLVYAFNFEITVWNRSALPENLYLLFMPLSVYFLTKDRLRNRDIFAFVFFAALNIVVKIDSYPFYLAIIFFLLPWSVITRSFGKTVKAIVFGSLASLAVLLALFAFTDCFKYVIPMYGFYFDMFGVSEPLLSRMIPSLHKLIILLIEIDPYILLSFLATIPILVINYSRLNKTDWFMIVFLSLTIITRLLVPAYLVYWKRVMFLFFPVFYLTFRCLFLLWDGNEVSFSRTKGARKILFGLVVLSISCLLVVPYLYFGEFVKAFYDSRDSFYFVFLIILGICGLNLVLLFKKNQRVEIILMSLVLFFVLTSVVINSLKIAKIYFPENIRYSYQENEKYAKLIPANAMIISHEQGFRGFVYLSKHRFYYNHDGGPNPVAYREILERRDLRYFILNIAEFSYERWGIPNKVRLELIKEVYPDLKLLGVMYVSKIPLAIYDKYGNK